jgi:molybdenum cofactor cytidylyltransferase
MGKIKALLPWGQTTILRHLLEEVKASGPDQILLVTGAHREEILREVDDFVLQTHHNPDWESGMGSSLSSGIVEAAHRFPDAGGLLVILVDQPLVGRAYLRQILREHRDFPTHIIASDYGSFAGVPALFPRRFWDALKDLSTDRGAKGLIASRREHCRVLDPGLAITDVDTPDAYRQALQQFETKTNKKES